MFENCPYDWVGDWEGPGHGKYVIRDDGREMEPWEIVVALRDLNDLKEQIARTTEVVNAFGTSMNDVMKGIEDFKRSYEERPDVVKAQHDIAQDVRAFLRMHGKD